MRAWKVCVPAGLAVALVASVAYAATGQVRVKNPQGHAVTVEYRVGPYAVCERNSDYVGSRTIPAGYEWILTVQNEGNACIRVWGHRGWWRNWVRRGQVHHYTVVD